MSDTVAVALITAGSTLLAGIGGILLGGVLQGRRDARGRAFQAQAEQRADERRIRDAKHERIRAAYIDLVTVGNRFVSMAKELGWFSTLEPIQKSMDAEIQSRMRELERTIAAVELEADTGPVLDTFREIRGAFGRYRMHIIKVASKGQTGADKETYQGMSETLNALEKSLPLLVTTAKRQLGELEKAL